MKALATCPHCNEQIETDCKACIESKTYAHHEPGLVVENVNWKLFPETEKELEETEENH